MRVPPLLRSAAHALTAALALAVPAGAQEEEAACPDGVVSEIFVDNRSVFDVGSEELDERFNWAYRTANRMHVRTREGVILRELLFRTGDCYVPALLQDSERLLRSLSFIADADVFAVRQPDGSQHVVVETRDEWSMRVEPQWDSDEGSWQLTGVELREDNLLGTGQHVAGYVKEHQGERVYGASVGTRQLFRTRSWGWRRRRWASRSSSGCRTPFAARPAAGRSASRSSRTSTTSWSTFPTRTAGCSGATSRKSAARSTWGW
jgi:outer membrane protein assembly factor BamA